MSITLPLPGFGWRSVCITSDGNVARSEKNGFLELIRSIRNCSALLRLKSYTEQVRLENKATADSVIKKFTAVYGHTFSFSTNKKIHENLISGRQRLTTGHINKAVRDYNSRMNTLSEKVKKHLPARSQDTCSNQDEEEDTKNWMVEKIVAIFGIDTEVNQRQTEFLLFCKEQCIDNDDSIRSLANWVLPENAHISLDDWVRLYSQIASGVVTDKFSAFIQAVIPDQPHKNMLGALFSLYEQIALATKLNNRNSSPETRQQWQKDFTFQLVTENNQAESILNNLISHTYTHQMLAFRHTLIASVDEKSAYHLQGILSVLDDILNACATCVGGDKLQQVKDWQEYYSQAKEDEETKKAEYGNQLAFIDRDFLTAWKKTCKKWMEIDPWKNLQVPKIVSTHEFDIQEKGTLFNELVALYRGYLFNVQKHNVPQPEMKLNSEIINSSKNLTEEDSKQVELEDGLNSGFRADINRAIYTVNGRLISQHTSEDESSEEIKTKRINAFKTLVNDYGQQVLISYFAFQSLFASFSKKFHEENPNKNPGRGLTSELHINNKEGSTTVTAITRYTKVSIVDDAGWAIDPETRNYIEVRIQLDLITLKGNLSYKLISDSPAITAAPQANSGNEQNTLQNNRPIRGFFSLPSLRQRASNS